jgi:hypothetical protein
MRKNMQMARLDESLRPSTVLTMLTIAFVTQPRIKQFINRPR